MEIGRIGGSGGLDKIVGGRRQNGNRAGIFPNWELWHRRSVESAFSLFKCGLKAAFHRVSLKHRQRHLSEFGNLKSPDLFGMTVRRMAMAGGMPYAQLVEENAFTPFIRK